MAVSVGGPQLGAVHRTSEEIREYPGVTAASPVALDVLELRHGTAAEYVLVVGVVAAPDLAVAGLPTSALAPGDPYYANGTYAGRWTGDAVLSAAAADLLGAEANDTLTVRGNYTFTVRSVTAAGAGSGVTAGAGSVPVALVHLAELQAVTGTTDSDTADQLLVATDDPGVRERLAGVYPSTDVVARSGVSSDSIADSELALAVGLGALVDGLFLGTTMGLEVTADRRQYATLAAIGVSGRSRGALVVAQVLVVTGLGGVLGVALGGAGILAANRLADALLGAGAVAVAHPALAPYGVGVALLVGLLASPYLVWLAGRTSVLEQLSR
ncbi:MAG: FtsX-like permease family protein, partial [Halobacteriaceae archaeon]